MAVSTKDIAAFTTYIAVFFSLVATYPTYVPASTCPWMQPKHEPYKEPQTSPSPYKLKIYHPHVVSNMTVPVCVIGKEPFLGMMIQAHDLDGNPIGNWITEHSDKMQTLNCSNPDDTVIHTNRTEKQILPLKWSAPADYQGTVVFKGAIVKDYTAFWRDITSEEFTVHHIKTRRNVN